MTLRAYIVSQFSRPRGGLGHVVGWVMAHRRSNIERNRWTVGLLDLQPDDHVLEIGCGPGIALEAAIATLQGGSITGIDHAAVMLRQAARRNAAALRSGRLALRCRSLEEFATCGTAYSKIFSVNVAQFFPDKVAAFRVLAGALAPDGVIATTYQPRHKGATDDDARSMAESLSKAMAEVGLIKIRTEFLPLRPVGAICVLGAKPS